MIKDFNDYFVGIALGVRFNPNFSVRDNFGSISDEILYKDDTFFGPKVFPKVMATNDFQQILINEDTKNQFRINNVDFILELNFNNDDDGFKVTDLGSIIQKYEAQIINGVMDKFSIKNIRRIGFIKKYLFDIDDIANKFIATTVGNIFDGISDCNVKFSKKIPLYESIARQKIDDFDNAIFTFVKNPDSSELNIFFDFQSIYEPPLSKSSSIKFKQFIQKSDAYFEKHFIPIVNEKIIGGVNVKK